MESLEEYGEYYDEQEGRSFVPSDALPSMFPSVRDRNDTSTSEVISISDDSDNDRDAVQGPSNTVGLPTTYGGATGDNLMRASSDDAKADTNEENIAARMPPDARVAAADITDGGAGSSSKAQDDMIASVGASGDKPRFSYKAVGSMRLGSLLRPWQVWQYGVFMNAPLGFQTAEDDSCEMATNQLVGTVDFHDQESVASANSFLEKARTRIRETECFLMGGISASSMTKVQHEWLMEAHRRYGLESGNRRIPGAELTAGFQERFRLENPRNETSVLAYVRRHADLHELRRSFKHANTRISSAKRKHPSDDT